MKTIISTVLATALLAGCSVQSTEGFPQLQGEAGEILDNGNFGNATMNNVSRQSSPEDYSINLARRFASEVNSTINFAFNSAALDADARATLTRQASWIKQFPEVRFRVYGHTDLVGSNAYNRALGLRRARAAVAFLTSQGINRSRLEAVASFGETRPVVETPNRERRNRRTVTEVSGFVETDPMVLNGKYAAIIFRDYVAPSAEARPFNRLE